MNEMTDEVLLPTFVNDLDGEEEAITDTAGFQTAQDGQDEKCATHNNSTGMIETVGFQTENNRVCEETAYHSTNIVMAEPVVFETIQEKGIEELGAENMLLKTLLGSLHKSIVEAKSNPITNLCTIKLDTPLYVQHRQSQEIFNIFKEMERDIKRFEDENKCLESLMSCLHKHISTGTEANRISFEPPSEIPPDSAVGSSYKAAQAIWRKFMKINRGKENNSKKNNKLLMSVEDMDRSLSRKQETVMKLRNRIKMLESDLESKSTFNEQLQTGYEKLQKRIDELTADLEQFKTKGKDTITKTNNTLLMSVEDMEKTLSRKKETVMKLRNRIKLLESDVQSKSTVNEQLQTGYEKLQMMNYSITARENETVSHLQNREHSLLLEINSVNAVNKQLHDDCQILQGRINVLTDDLEQCKISFQIQKDLNKAMDEKWKSDRELLQKAKYSMNMMEIQMANHQQREITFKAAYDAEVMKTENQQKHIDGLQLKSDELLNRLSKLAGDRLIHENTNITDLSDANRPTKLAETYSELYDNEWTDAFEELISRNLTDNEAVGKLLDMLLMSFHKCREITWERYRSLQSIMSTIDIHVCACVRGFPEGTKTTATQSGLSSHTSNNTNVTINLEASNEEHLVCTTTMSFDQEKEIKRIWRTTTTALRDEAVKHLHSVLLTRCDISIDAFPKTSKYLAICIDLCWKMGVQERPMHLDADVETGDSSEKMLDLNKFRPYTKTGKRVAFVVWPALFLHEGGPMIVKGIAQGCNETD